MTSPTPQSYMPGASTSTGPAQPAPKNRTPLIVAAVVALLIVIGGTVALTLSLAGGNTPAPATAQAAAAPTTFRVVGYLTLSGAGTFIWESEDNPVCAGREGFDDVKQGAQIVVTDSAGATVGVGTLGQGLAKYQTMGDQNLGTECTFSFEVPGVPAGKDFYGVEVTHRGSVKYSEAQLQDALRLTLN